MPKKISFSRILDAASQEATGSKTIAYRLTTFAAGLVYVFFSIFLFFFGPKNLLPVFWFIMPMFYALCFSPIRYGLEELILQLFPNTDYNSHALIKYLNTISYSTLTINKLTNRFFESLETKFDSPKAAFIIFNKPPQIITSSHFDKLKNMDILLISKLFQNPPVSVTRAHYLNIPLIKEKLVQQEIQIIVPLSTNQQIHGFLLLGNKSTHSPYTTKDIKVLTAIAPKIGYAILNAKEYEKVELKNKILIKDLEEANDRLRRFNNQLKHDSKLKDEFLYVATHELKNPVTAMRGYLSLINEGDFGKVPNKIKSALNSINSSNQQIISLLNNLLQIARSEAEHLDIKVKPIIICDVIDEVIRDVQPLLKQKSLTITHSCPNRFISVMADKERLREIISNLISNAIKYSEQGSITITHDINKDHLATHVSDEGVGINHKDQAKIFTRFFRVEEEAAKGIPGTGLGLFIIKNLVEKMHGRIWFNSNIGKGSIFSFSLPLARTYSLKSE